MRFKHLGKTLFLAIFLQTLIACNHIPSPQERQQTFDTLIQQHHWQQHILKGNDFDLIAAMPQKPIPQSQLVIYLEGDGLAWLNRTQISNNPTPITPIALQLALLHPAQNAVYLARPCQYVITDSAPNCTPNTWTSARFSEAATQATNNAIEQLKQNAQAQTLVLVGYSGGAALALLVAARRSDVQKIITIAGNLDPQAWTQLHAITPLNDSLTPVNYLAKLEHIPQLHFVGENDSNTPPQLAENFLKRFNERSQQELRIIRHFDHQCCWVKEWARLYPEQDFMK